MANSYFTLTTSNSSLSKKFKVLYTGYANGLQKTSTVEKTVDGNLDISVGSIHEYFTLTVRVRKAENAAGDTAGMGDEADLKYFYSLNNPLGTPSNHITMVDHYGNTKTVMFLGDYNPQNQSVMIEGENAWILVNINLQVL